MKHCVLMVEDEMYLAMILKDLLSDAGYRVLCAARLNDAMRLAQEESIDAAVLDINLHGETVYPLAARLEEQGVPFLFASAYAESSIPDVFRDHPVLRKPYTPDSMIDTLASVLEASRARSH